MCRLEARTEGRNEKLMSTKSYSLETEQGMCKKKEKNKIKLVQTSEG